MRTLILFAHPFFEHSIFNAKIVRLYRNRENVIFRDLYEFYPDFHIAAYRERKKIQEYDQIIFHFPLIWCGIPPLLSLWLSEVLDMKWLNRNIENPLKGKKSVIIVSSGGSQQSYTPQGMYGHSLQDFTLQLQRSLEVNQIKICEIISIPGARQRNDTEIEQIKQQISKHLH